MLGEMPGDATATAVRSESGGHQGPVPDCEPGGSLGDRAGMPCVEEAAQRSEEPVDPSRETLNIQARIRKLIGQGFPHYTEVLDLLADKITADEAEEARQANRRDLRLLGAVVVCGALIQLLMFRVPKSPVNLQIFLYDLFDAGSLIVPLLLVSGCRIHFAGRLLVPLAALGSQYRHPVAPWSFVHYALILLLMLGCAYALGALLDFGASTVPERRWARSRRWALLLLGLIHLGLTRLTLVSLGGYLPVLSIASALACCLWGWIPGERLERQAGLPKVDSETVRLTAMSRWGLFARGRALAICIVIVPCILFLDGTDLRKRLEPQAGAVRTNVEGKEQLWFWTHKGEFLTQRHLKNENFYAFLDSEMNESELQKIWQMDHSLRGTIHDADNYETLKAAYTELQRFLKPRQLKSPEQFEELLASASKDNRLELYHLARDPIRAKGPIATVPFIFTVEDQVWEGTNRLIPVTGEDIRKSKAHNGIWQWLLLGFGLMGFTFLWRRGGDSVLARWLGIWLMGVGIVGSYRYAQLFLPALGFDLWHRSLVHPSGNLILSILVLLDLITLAVAFLFAAFVPLAAIWTQSCWPHSRSNQTRRRWRPSLPTWLRIVVVSLIMNVGFYSILLGLPELWPEDGWGQAEVVSALVAVIVFTVVAFTVGYRLWRPRRSTVRPLEWILGLLLLGLQSVVIVAIVIDEPAGGAAAFRLAGLGLGFILLAILVFLIFRRDLFHVSAARDFSFVIVFMLIPALFAWSEDLSKDYLFHLMQGLVVSQRGAEILGVVLAISLLPPISKLVERGILRISAPRLRRIHQCIEETLEKLTEEGGDPLVPLGDALRTCGLDRFAFYRRIGAGRFEALLRQEMEAKDQVRISPQLLQFLTNYRDVLDLDRVALEWRLFFVQFELHRVRADFAGRYLLPVCLGSSLRGFLVVPRSAGQERRLLIKSPLIQGLSTLGIAAAHLPGGRHKPPEPLAEPVARDGMAQETEEIADLLPGSI